MQKELKRLEAARREANQLLAEGFKRRYPLLLTVLAVRMMFRREGLPQPDDVLAFASGGKVNMNMVDDWQSPYG